MLVNLDPGIQVINCLNGKYDLNNRLLKVGYSTVSGNKAFGVPMYTISFSKLKF